jgi:HK97 family phage major capsid protein
MASNKQSFPRETASATVSWGNTTGESEPAIEEVEIDAYEYSCFSVVKNTTLRDATSDIVSWLTLNLSESAGLGLDDVAFNSSGAEMPYCSGLLTAACGYSVVMGSTKTSFADLSQKDLSEMIGKLDGVRKGGAKYYMHGSIIHYVRTLEDENRRPIFNNGLVGVPSIFGYPYTEVIKMPSTDGADTAFILFGNLKNFFIGRIVNSTTLDVNPWEYWTTNRTAFKLYQRWGMKIALPKAFVRLLTASA